MVCTIASDAHTWNLMFLQLLLEDHGFAVHNLGSCVPVVEVVDCCLRERPHLLVLSTVNGHGLIEAPGFIQAVRNRTELRSLPVVVGGKLNVDGAVPDDDVRNLLRLGFDAVFASAAAAEEFPRFLAHVGQAAAAN
ncbi:cobalamin B12-binding domain-containing protein [Nonomuraea sp. SYSU D8015]|uniref:cobalamin B12-binding domain-containing protein n=1 Tax=Nonomuraea sp. SYSU D8015 TaxID=2593644 RepID=UPI0021D1C2BD|nr:cobalamin-dependent protein [Nonomuraea sp. SYSU D8015]